MLPCRCERKVCVCFGISRRRPSPRCRGSLWAPPGSAGGGREWGEAWPPGGTQWRGRAGCTGATSQPEPGNIGKGSLYFHPLEKLTGVQKGGGWKYQTFNESFLYHQKQQPTYQQSCIVDRQTLQKVGKAWLELHGFITENKKTKYVAQDSEDGNCWNENPFYPKLNDIANTFWITFIFPGHLGPIQSWLYGWEFVLELTDRLESVTRIEKRQHFLGRRMWGKAKVLVGDTGLFSFDWSYTYLSRVFKFCILSTKVKF